MRVGVGVVVQVQGGGHLDVNGGQADRAAVQAPAGVGVDGVEHPHAPPGSGRRCRCWPGPLSDKSGCPGRRSRSKARPGLHPPTRRCRCWGRRCPTTIKPQEARCSNTAGYLDAPHPRAVDHHHHRVLLPGLGQRGGGNRPRRSPSPPPGRGLPIFPPAVSPSPCTRPQGGRRSRRSGCSPPGPWTRSGAVLTMVVQAALAMTNRTREIPAHRKTVFIVRSFPCGLVGCI